MSRTSLSAAALTALALAAPAAAQPTLDHLACFKVNDHARPATYSFSLTNAAGTQNCVAKLPAKFDCFESAASKRSCCSGSVTRGRSGPGTTSGRRTWRSPVALSRSERPRRVNYTAGRTDALVICR